MHTPYRTPLARLVRLYSLLTLLSAALLAASSAHAQSEQRRLVTASTLTFNSFYNDPDMAWLRQNLGRARAVMIVPEFTKAGIIVGGAGGRAVVVVRDPKSGRWAGPAFYSLVTASIGLQAGVSVSEVVTLIMTEKAVSKLLANSFRLGGDVALAVGPVGGGAQSAFVADVVSFSRGHGVYVGLNLDGTIVSTSDDWNDLYYGRHVQAPDILMRTTVRSPHAKELLNVIATAAKNSAAKP